MTVGDRDTAYRHRPFREIEPHPAVVAFAEFTVRSIAADASTGRHLLIRAEKP